MDKIKVLHIVGGMDIGGTETMLMNLYRKIHKDIRFDFISYYEKDAYYDNEIKRLGGKIIRVESPNKSGQIKLIRNLTNIIKKENYDIVHAHTLFNCGSAMVAAKLGGAKIRISHAHTNLDLENNSLKKFYFSLMRFLIIGFSNKFLACSNSAGKYLFGEKVVEKSKRYKVLPNYINYEELLKISDSNIRRQLGIKESDILVCHVGRFVEAKNHKFLIEILEKMIKKNKNIKAVLIGDGYLKDKIQKKVIELNSDKNILFLGLRNDVKDILNESDIFIFPSIYEGLGLVVLEAQACGLPCLVSEAIQEEAILNIGLVKQINLSDGLDLWADKALKLIGKKDKNKIKIKDEFNRKGYDIENIINTLKNVYEIE